jgi:methionyl-tRNA formyltransferase
MRTVLLANNRLGADVGRFLIERDELIAVVVHPLERRKYGEALTGLGVPTFEWPNGLDEIRRLSPHCLFSVLFGYRVPPQWLDVPTWKAINLHPGLLPWNGGACPNVWPLIDETPAGTTLHVMDVTFDTGAVLAQESVPTYPEDTAETLYHRLEVASLLLLHHHWPTVKELVPRPQQGHGSFHRVSELRTLDPGSHELALIDRLRALTFPPYGAEFERHGRRYRIRVQIEPVN